MFSYTVFWPTVILAPFAIAFMIIWKCTGYYMAMYLAGITSISGDIYEAARIDGANGVQMFFQITVPLLKSVTSFVVITSAIYALQLFDEPNLLFTNQSSSTVGGPSQSCLTMVWNFYNQAFGGNPRMGYASALSCVLFLIIVVVSLAGLFLVTIPLLILFIFGSKSFIKGLTAGAVKG